MNTNSNVTHLGRGINLIFLYEQFYFLMQRCLDESYQMLFALRMLIGTPITYVHHLKRVDEKVKIFLQASELVYTQQKSKAHANPKNL